MSSYEPERAEAGRSARGYDSLVTLLTVNSGSTSVKLGLYEPGPAGTPLRLGGEQHTGHDLDPSAVLRALAERLRPAPEAIAHRIVHGGTRFVRPTRIDAEVITAIGELAPPAAGRLRVRAARAHRRRARCQALRVPWAGA